MSSMYKCKNTRNKKTTKFTDQSKIRHSNHIDGKAKVKSINFSKTNMITITCRNLIET